MHQGLPYCVNDLLVEFRLFTNNLQLKFFIELNSQITDQPVEARENLAYGNHTGFHNTALEVLGNPRHLFHPVFKLVYHRLVVVKLPHFLIEFIKP